jgi:D-3-phosphoglycerate dehydrogenase
MSGRILGIAGFGATGRAFWEKIQGFAFSKILVTDPHGEVRLEAIREKAGGLFDMTQAAPFDELLCSSDFISLHVPLNDSTRHFINSAVIAKMKKGAVIINTSRGAVIEEAALVGALKSGQVAYAGLDVFEKEPLPADHPFLSFPNVVLTDHSAYYSAESVSELKTRTAQNALDVLEGRIPQTAVNNPVIME